MAFGPQNIDSLVKSINKIRPVYASMTITQRDTGDPSPNNISIVAHPSGTDILNPLSAPVTAGPGPFGGYHKITGLLPDGAESEITVVNSEFIIPVDGVYSLPIGWAGFRHSQNNATIGFVIGIERAGQISFTPRPVSSKQPNGGDIENVSGGGQLELEAGDKISAWVSSNVTGTVTIGNSNAILSMLEDTT